VIQQAPVTGNAIGVDGPGLALRSGVAARTDSKEKPRSQKRDLGHPLRNLEVAVCFSRERSLGEERFSGAFLEMFSTERRVVRELQFLVC
jgi:hypothetical protein